MKTIVISLFTVAVFIVLVHLIHSLTLDRIIEYTTHNIESKKIKKNLDGYKMTFISDVHNMSEEEYNQVIVYINENIKPDVLLLGGDFMSNGRVEEFIDISSRSSAEDGIFLVVGNHDNAKVFEWTTEGSGVTFLRNTGKLVRDNIFIAGVEDYWKGTSDLKEAIKTADDQDFVLLLTHNPDVVMDVTKQEEMKKIDYTISGHTHGGQVAFFSKFRPALRAVTDYGSLFSGGFVRTKDEHSIYVSRGTGYYSKIPRVFSRPEVATFVLQSTLDD